MPSCVPAGALAFSLALASTAVPASAVPVSVNGDHAGSSISEAARSFDRDSVEGHLTGKGLNKVIGVRAVVQKAMFDGADAGRDPFAELSFRNVDKVLKVAARKSANIDDDGATPVPLPASLTLLLGALGGLAYISRRRRSMSGG